MLRPTRHGKPSDFTKYRALKRRAPASPTPVPAPVVVSFADTVNPAGVEQPACTLCGDCCSGCNVGAKNTVALTHLPDAKAAHGAEIFTELTVSHIARKAAIVRPFRAEREPRCSLALRGSQDGSALRRHARLDRDPVSARARAVGVGSAWERFSANGDIIAFALGGEGRVNGIGARPSAEIRR
jgi:cholesterol oxidase